MSAAKAPSNAWLIAFVVAIAAFMEVLDTTIANVALNYIAGSLGVSEDESSWVVTTYLVANAIIVTATGYFAKRLGRKKFFLGCLGLFTVSSVACGFVTNLDQLLFLRVFQGFAGGGMVPVAQSILADSFPQEKRGQAFALFGLAVVVAPVVGPTLGGWLSDNWSWHWCFLINGPVGVLAMVLIWVLIDEKQEKTEVSFDGIGFALIALALGALEIVMDRGQVDDWFDSPFIVKAAWISGICFAILIPWELSRKSPLIDIKMFGKRQFAACFIVMAATGAILLATTNILPQLTQEAFGYTATWAGLALSPGGLVTVFVMIGVGQFSSKIPAKYMIAFGAATCALSMYWMTWLNADSGFWYFAEARMLTGIGLPMIFVPIIAASYEGLKPSQTDSASALLNAARNTGGSFGVSLAGNVLAHREQFHQARLAEATIPSSPNYQNALSQITHFFVSSGSSQSTANSQAIAWIGQTITQQSAILAYIDVFYTLALMALAAVPLALLLRGGKPKKAPAGAH